MFYAWVPLSGKKPCVRIFPVALLIFQFVFKDGHIRHDRMAFYQMVHLLNHLTMDLEKNYCLVCWVSMFNKLMSILIDAFLIDIP